MLESLVSGLCSPMNFIALPMFLSSTSTRPTNVLRLTAALTLALPWLNEPMTTVRSFEFGDCW